MLWYNVGKVAVTLNNKTVTGTGTAWLANVRNGDAFRGPDGQIYLVENVATNTSLTISPAYASASGTGKDYAIVPVQGYQRDLADQVVELIGTYGSLGTAAAATLTTSTTDSTTGRVMRIADWGLGTNNGVAGEPVITDNTAAGFYRSGTGTANGKPVNNSGDGFIKFGWSGAYATYLYGSPNANKLWFKHLSNGVDMGWNELMIAGTGGIGRFGADASQGDVFPADDLSALNIGAGLYYVTSTIGNASGLPFGTTASAATGLAVHRQSGSGGGQLFISAGGQLAVRGRLSGNWGTFNEVIRAGDYGIGKAQATPPNGRGAANPSGWYYGTSGDSFGGGSFFLDLAYNTTAINSGLRLSTNPYSDRFFLHGAVSGSRDYRLACEIWHSRNTTVDSNGFIKSASPIIHLAQDGITLTNHLEIGQAVFERVGVGHYKIKGVPLLSRDGWYIETPKDRNGNIYFTLDYEETETGLTIKTYTPDYTDGPAKNGEPVDILEGRYVSLRFAEDPSLYPVEEPEPEPEPENPDGLVDDEEAQRLWLEQYEREQEELRLNGTPGADTTPPND